MGRTKKKTTEEFIKEAKEINGNKYDYSKVVYVNQLTEVCIICPIHGEFWQKPKNHLKGRGCPKCRRHCEKPKDEKCVHNQFSDGITFGNIYIINVMERIMIFPNVLMLI